jgi:hypothetical protein
LNRIGLIDGQDKPIKTKRTIPATVIGHIQLLIQANGGAGDLPQYLVDPVQQTAAYYYSDEHSSSGMSHESIEPSDSQSFPCDGSDSGPHEGVAVPAVVPRSPATQQLLHDFEFSAHSSPDIYFDESRSDLSISSDGVSNFSAAADVDLFFDADYSDELLDNTLLNFM